MALAKFIEPDDFTMPVARAIAEFPEIADDTLRVGADIIADEIKRRLQGELLPESRAGELVQHFGITPMQRDKDGNYNVSIGWGGYQEPPYGRFPRGVPFMLIARSFQSGAVRGGRFEIDTSTGKRKKKTARELRGQYWRKPTHFASKAVRAVRGKALTAMEKYAEERLAELKKK